MVPGLYLQGFLFFVPAVTWDRGAFPDPVTSGWVDNHLKSSGCGTSGGSFFYHVCCELVYRMVMFLCIIIFVSFRPSNSCTGGCQLVCHAIQLKISEPDSTQCLLRVYLSFHFIRYSNCKSRSFLISK